MKFTLVVFFCLCVLSAAFVDASLKVKKAQLKKRATNPDIDLCKPCIEFMDEALQELIEIIANGGVIGSCDALCSLLPNSIEAGVCNILCDIVGIDEFIKLLNAVDPDPIFICEELGTCPHRVGDVVIDSTTVAPQAGGLGTTFTFTLDFTVLNETGTGEIYIEIDPPGYGEPLSDGELIESVQPGDYSVQFSVKAQQSEDEPWSAGQYTAFFAICEGSCFSPHKWAFQYANSTVNFHLRN
jgi:hypothetical protein